VKIHILAGLDASLLNFRGSLIRELISAGHEVVCSAPPGKAGVAAALAVMGARFVPVPSLQRAGLNPWHEMATRRELRAIFERERPDVLLAYTIKPIVHGLPAAHAAGIPRLYAMITGLGAAFNSPGIKGWCFQMLAIVLYRRALKNATRVIAQNEDIAQYLLERQICTKREQILVVQGSGVDATHFIRVAHPKGPPVFLLLARMLRDKGVEEYVAAARLVRQKLPAARFLLVGDTDPNPAAISKEQLNLWNEEGAVEYQSAVADVRPLLSGCTVYVLPSYHEGMPRSVLEAMAIGRPVITTDTIGCRDTVINAGPPDHEGIRTGGNGLLVPVRRVKPLAAAMLRLARDIGLQEAMGRRGREIVEQQFDVRIINDLMLRAMDLQPPSKDFSSLAPSP